MTVRTRKTITDLIQQLKVQEKEIKSQLSDGQRRLNETRDRIATCYWVIEEIGDVEDDEDYDMYEYASKGVTLSSCRAEEMPREEWENLIRTNPNLSGVELEKIVRSQGFLVPEFYEGCPCPDCSCEPVVKPKPKAKPLPKKKPTKKGKK